MTKIMRGPGPDGKPQALTTLKGASEFLGVPASSLKYYLLRGDLTWVNMGPYKLVDAERARLVLQKAGYKRREKVA